MKNKILFLAFFIFNNSQAMSLSDISESIKNNISKGAFTYSDKLEETVCSPKDGVAQEYYPKIERDYNNPSNMDLSIMRCALYAESQRVDKIEAFLSNNAQILRIDQISTLKSILAIPALSSLKKIKQHNKSIEFWEFYIEKTVDTSELLALNIRITFLVKTFAESTGEDYCTFFRDKKDMFNNGFLRLFISPCTEVRTEPIIEGQKERHVLFGATRIALDPALVILEKLTKSDFMHEEGALALQ